MLLFGILIMKGSTDAKRILREYDEDKYFFTVKKTLFKELNVNKLKIDNVSKRSKKNQEYNILLIPQYNIKYDTLNNQMDIVFDSLYPINRTILFDKDKIMGSLLFTTKYGVIFCPKKITIHTNLNCSKYICGEKQYYRSLKQLLRKKPLLIFKDPNFERVWFFIDKEKNVCVFTYDLEYYSLEDFFKINELWKYSMPNPTIKNFR